MIGEGIGDSHFPGRAPIDAYGNGGFRFAEMSHKGSLLFLPSGVWGWPVGDFDALTPDDFSRVLDPAEIDFLLFGTGDELRLPATAIRDAFAAAGIGLEPMDTGAAARTYNVVLGEGRRVGAALLAVD